MVGRVITPDGQIGVKQFILVQPVSVWGHEAEGAPGVIADLPGPPVAVYLVGSRVARTGDLLVCRFVNFRWVAQRRGSLPDRQPVLNCPCATMPRTITQVSSNENSRYRSCTYVWGQFPPGAPFPDRNYYSQQSFLDEVTNDLFYHYVNCNLGFIFMGRWFPQGSDGNLYANEGTLFQWLVGMPGNTCDPFLMSNGQVLPGVIGPQFVTLNAP